MTKLILLIGFPDSRKSYFAAKLLAECPQSQLLPTEAIRTQWFG